MQNTRTNKRRQSRLVVFPLVLSRVSFYFFTAPTTEEKCHHVFLSHQTTHLRSSHNKTNYHYHRSCYYHHHSLNTAVCSLHARVSTVDASLWPLRSPPPPPPPHQTDPDSPRGLEGRCCAYMTKKTKTTEKQHSASFGNTWLIAFYIWSVQKPSHPTSECPRGRGCSLAATSHSV